MKYNKNLAILLEVLALFFATSNAVNQVQFQGGNYIVSWNYLSASQEIEFEVRVKTTGYVALGLTKTNSAMQSLDLFVGGVSAGGTTYLKDYYVSGKTVPTEDAQQDYSLVSATESNGETMVRCKRRINTQDAKDLQIQPGDKVYIAWAYHTSSDSLTYHSSRGYSAQMYELVPVPQTTTSSPTTAPTTAPTTVPTTAPTTATTTGPSTPPSTTPSTPPSTAPSTPPSTTPSTPPTTAPSTPPTTAPSTPPTTAPSTPPTTAPSTPPTTAPSTPPTTAPTPAPSIGSNKELSFKNGDYLVSWKFDSNTNELFFKLVVKATGWVGLGISNTNSNMKDLDVVIAGVSGGQGYIDDYYSTAKATPPRDSKQDYHLVSSSENGDTTTVEFKRKLDTGDAKDQLIKIGESYYIAWAYHSSSDSLIYHSQRGYSSQKVVLVTADSSSTTTAIPRSTIPTTTTQKPVPTTTASVIQCSLVLVILPFFASLLLK